MPTPFSGGCACGAIRYRCNASPLAMYNCHCATCRRAAGAAFSPLLVVAVKAIEVSGSPVYYTARNDAGNHAACGFCAGCGSPLFARSDARPDILLVRAGSLENGDWYKPVADIWTAGALSWAFMDRHIPKVFKSPPLLEAKDAVTT